MNTMKNIKFAGLCNGAKSMHSSIAAFTSSVITTEPANFSPPCTTRCPTAPTSSRLLITPVFSFVKASSTNWIASVCVGIARSETSFSPPAGVYTSLPSIPIRSQRPFASTLSVSALIS